MIGQNLHSLDSVRKRWIVLNESHVIETVFAIVLVKPVHLVRWIVLLLLHVVIGSVKIAKIIKIVLQIVLCEHYMIETIRFWNDALQMILINELCYDDWPVSFLVLYEQVLILIAYIRDHFYRQNRKRVIMD